MTMIDRKICLSGLRAGLFKGEMSAGQEQGLLAILDGYDKAAPGADRRWLAYILATAYHESAFTLQPVRETLADSDDKAIALLESAFERGKLSWVKTPYWRKDEDGKSWLGRGLVQLTHKRNYETMSKVTGIDLVAHPEKAMEMETAVLILIDGMIAGRFTGKRLCDYLNAQTEDWVNARRIVNGLDRAEKLADYARMIDRVLLEATVEVSAEAAAKPAADAARRENWLMRIGRRVIAALVG